MSLKLFVAVYSLTCLIFCGCELDSYQKQSLLDLQNYWRQLIANGAILGQPPAADMLQLVWNAESAVKAQAMTDKCVYHHDLLENRLYQSYIWVGQNIASLGSKNISKGIFMWFDEQRFYNYNDNSCSKFCLHYTQLIWSRTREVGCGGTLCNIKSRNVLLVTCNYGPGGNIEDQKPYIVGPACSSCPVGTTCNNGLCN